MDFQVQKTPRLNQVGAVSGFRKHSYRRCQPFLGAAAFKGLDDDGGAAAPLAPPQSPYKYKRVMLKLSGEALEGDQKFGIDPDVLRKVAGEVAEASRHGVQIAIVVGGGNFFRGINRWDSLERTTADYVGMLATVMNAIALQSELEKEGVQVGPAGLT
jgi:hypothetical protein